MKDLSPDADNVGVADSRELGFAERVYGRHTRPPSEGGHADSPGIVQYLAARLSVNKPLLLDLARGDYLTRRENVLFVGPSGTGKTHLATALGLAPCAQGKKVRFWRVTELITTLREAEEDRQLIRLRHQLSRLDLLILDELGYVPASKAGAELLFDVIATAYERSSIVLTTNLGFEHWTEVLGNERLTGAALDRLTHRASIVETVGESCRLQDAKRRRKP